MSKLTDRTNIFNSATKSGGAIYAHSNISLSFIGSSDFSQNSAERYGGAIEACVNIALIFTKTINFFNNSASSDGGGVIYVMYNASLGFNGTSSSLTSNSALRGGAIFSYESTMIFNGKISFANNGYNTGYSWEVQCICTLVQLSPLCPIQLCIWRTIMHI